jgi:DNA-binding IclR family transcriptional regulator
MPTARDRPPEEAQEDTSFGRGLRVLLTIADRGEVRADELSVLLETPVSTVYRYLRTLAGFGFVDRHGAVYRLGPRLVIGSGGTVTAEELIRVADPILHRLVEETGETALIVRRIGTAAVCLHEVPSGQPLRVTIAPATALPLRVGALGTVLLAYAPDEVVDEVLGEEAAPEIDDASADALRTRLAAIVAQGSARSAGEVIAGAVAVAVPILAADGIVAAIGVVGPEARCGAAWQTRVERLLVGVARSMGISLGAGRSSQDFHHPEGSDSTD